MKTEILPGTRVSAFCLFANITSNNGGFMPGTVVCRYGYRSIYKPKCIYPDNVDICFDHELDRISYGHFTDGVEVIE